MNTPLNWYVSLTGTHQAAIADETTGRTVALAYDKADAPLLAAAPAMLTVLKNLHGSLGENGADLADFAADIREAIALATGSN